LQVFGEALRPEVSKWAATDTRTCAAYWPSSGCWRCGC